MNVLFLYFFRHQSEKRIRQLPEIDGLSKDTVVTSWMAKYDALMKGTFQTLNRLVKEQIRELYKALCQVYFIMGLKGSDMNGTNVKTVNETGEMELMRNGRKNKSLFARYKKASILPDIMIFHGKLTQKYSCTKQ